MIAALLLAAAVPQAMTAVDAERAFAADAKKLGQWTAFRKWADSDAVMYNPQAVWAHEMLRSFKDPPKSVEWWPEKSWVSCDGRTAVNTGPWRLPSAVGYFTTLWMREGRQPWRWTVDGGDSVKVPLGKVPPKVTVRKGSCRGRPTLNLALGKQIRSYREGTQPPGDSGYSRSADGTLIYMWKVEPDGARRTEVQLWDGRKFDKVLDQAVAAPPSKK